MGQVKIRIEGRLDKRWTDWLEGITLTHTEEEQTLICGPVQDQAALYGLMTKLRNLGVVLVSVNYWGQPAGEEPK